MIGSKGFLLSSNSGTFVCIRNCLLRFHQNTSENAFKHATETILPSKPKRPRSPFLLYIEHIKPAFMEKNPNMKYSEVLVEASKKWAELGPIEKENFKMQYNENYKIYAQELKEYNDSLSDEQKEALKELKNDTKKKKKVGGPKRPLNAFVIYVTSMKGKKLPETSFAKWMQSLAANWKNMSDEEKTPYLTEAAKQKTQYEENLK